MLSLMAGIQSDRAVDCGSDERGMRVVLNEREPQSRHASSKQAASMRGVGRWVSGHALRPSSGVLSWEGRRVSSCLPSTAEMHSNACPVCLAKVAVVRFCAGGGLTLCSSTFERINRREWP